MNITPASQNAIVSLPSPDMIVPPRWMQRILRIPVFRIANDDLIARICMAVHSFFVHPFRWFHSMTAKRSLDRFISLGAKVEFVTPRDGKGRIQMMAFRAEDLDQKIRDSGGSWERRELNGRTVFAIIPPKEGGKAWDALKEKIAYFGWREEGEIIITCDSADLIPDSAPKRCFLYAHTASSSFTSDWKRAGVYIGAKQDLCFFNNGNTFQNSNRPVSERSFYLEIDAVYERIRNSYPPEQLWVGGTCGGAPIAAYLKRRLHDQGVNFFAEQSFVDMADVIKHNAPFGIGSWLAPRMKGSLGDEGIPEPVENPPPSCQFGVEKLWASLPLRKGKIILIEAREDEYIPKSESKRYLDLANRVSTNVQHILFPSTASWKHADDHFLYPQPLREFIQAVFS